MTHSREGEKENETHATFRLLGDALDPAEVTRILGITPSFARRKGDKYGGPRRPVASRTGIWALESEKSVTSADLEKHLEFLLNQLDAKASLVAELTRGGLTADILCYWMSATGQGGPVLGAATIRRIAELGVDLDFDCYSAV